MSGTCTHIELFSCSMQSFSSCTNMGCLGKGKGLPRKSAHNLFGVNYTAKNEVICYQICV